MFLHRLIAASLAAALSFCILMVGFAACTLVIVTIAPSMELPVTNGLDAALPPMFIGAFLCAVLIGIANFKENRPVVVELSETSRRMLGHRLDQATRTQKASTKVKAYHGKRTHKALMSRRYRDA